MEPLHHRHGEDYKAVLVGFEVAKEGVGDVSDHSGLFLNVDAYLGNSAIGHNCSPILINLPCLK